MPSPSPPYVLLLVVKSGHVGSEWLAELVHKQRFGAFKHEANACVRSQDLVSGLITGAGCSKVSTRDNSSLPLLGLSFNVGAFGDGAIATWTAALHATKYATEASNPRLADPRKVRSGTHACAPCLGQAYDAHHGRLADADEHRQVGVVGLPPPGLHPHRSPLTAHHSPFTLALTLTR